ncbi:MAG: phytanoyl-CoA dioxygenase family protein [Candidatus Latescibacteria bacterium]|nr:phytanoyl-CoA dioxygenase family protein [Candidatus Latescibacterota bacterium]
MTLSLEPTPSERRKGKLSAIHLQWALRTLRDTGLVILERALPEDWIAAIRAACDRDVKSYLKDPALRKQFLVDAKGHIGMPPKQQSPYMDALAIANPFATQILDQMMGPEYFCTYYNTNITWPGSAVQALHRDTHLLFPELNVALPPHTVVVNIMLVDFTLANGATEVWPGSHLIVDRPEDQGVPLEERARALPSLRTVAPAGSLVVRDLRMWHRGMPNQTDLIRTMLAIVYFRRFMHRSEVMTIPQRVWDTLPEKARQLFRHNRVGRPGKPS